MEPKYIGLIKYQNGFNSTDGGRYFNFPVEGELAGNILIWETRQTVIAPAVAILYFTSTCDLQTSGRINRLSSDSRSLLNTGIVNLIIKNYEIKNPLLKLSWRWLHVPVRMWTLVYEPVVLWTGDLT